MSDATYHSDAHFAGLVQAATAAADQEGQWPANLEHGNVRSSQLHDHENTAMVAGEDGIQDQYGDPTSMNHAYTADTQVQPRRKRKRGTETQNPTPAQYDGRYADPYPLSQSPVTRPPPSAAVLFRQRPENGKKYTRPPMSKLYESLEISPESFLHLQAAAKDFMINDDHPERYDTIGSRGRGDSDLVKLKLWKFTQDFLEEDDRGQEYFGEHALPSDGLEQRSMVWPQDAEQIIKACLPLMRRMVTNERQRRYAVESRGKVAGSAATDGDETSTLLYDNLTAPGSDAIADPVEPGQERIENGTSINTGQTAALTERKRPAKISAANAAHISSGEAERKFLTLQINLVTSPDGTAQADINAVRRIAPPFYLAAASHPSLAALRKKIRQNYGSTVKQSSSPDGAADEDSSMMIKVWLPDGVVQVRNDGEWMVALLSAETVDWMDDEVKVLVEVAE